MSLPVPVVQAALKDQVDVSWAKLLGDRAAVSAEKVGLRHKRRGSWTAWRWGAIDAEVRQLAAGWRRLGLLPGHRVVIFANRRPRVLFTLLAVQACGAVPVLIDPSASAGALGPVVQEGPAHFAFVAAQSQFEALVDAGALAGFTGIVYDDPRELAPAGGDVVTPYEALRAVGESTAPVPDDGGAPARRIDVVTGGPASVSHLIDNLAGQARKARRTSPVGRTDELLMVEPLVTLVSLEQVMARWLLEGFVLALPETETSALQDLVAVRPTHLPATAAFFSALWLAVAERLPAPGTWRRRLIDAGLRVAADRTGPSLRTAIAGGLVVRPLARVLGLHRVQSIRVTAGVLPRAAQTFFAALGVGVDPATHLSSDGDPTEGATMVASVNPRATGEAVPS